MRPEHPSSDTLLQSKASLSRPSGAGTMTRERQAAMTPARAIQALRDGNTRFVSGRPLARDLRAQAAAEEQFPFAAIVSCIDSRTSSELVFDQGLGDVFNARIAGNVVDSSVLGGLEFACQAVGAKAILIVGHTACGAIKGAIDQVEFGHLTGLLQRIEPAVVEALTDHPERTSLDPQLVAAVTRANVRVSMRRVLEESAILRALCDRGALVIAGAVVDLATGVASFLED